LYAALKLCENAIRECCKWNVINNKQNSKNDMELQGRIIAAMPERSGVSARGEWKSQDFVLETHDAYPRKMVFSVFGADRLARFNIQVGQEVTVSFDIDAHEYQGRWYNSVRAFDVRLVDVAATAAATAVPAGSAFGAAPAAPTAAAPQASPFEAQSDSTDDGLPF
jgi:hypothetical protein